MLITTARHERLLADAIRNAEESQQIAAKALAAVRKLTAENATLRGQLAIYTGPRKRGERGRFLSTKGEAA